jgi:release factor glutamine methyltransferase
MSAPAIVSRALARSGLIPLDAKVLLGHVLGRDRAWLAAHGDATLTREQLAAFESLTRRRHGGEPIAYLTGRREFFGLEIEITREVLIPRPETELLVDHALAVIPAGAAVDVLDLGCGSGAVALAIAHKRPQARVLGTDLAPQAVELARRNAQRLGIANATFLVADWFEAVPRQSFGLIVANPPYVAEADPHLEQGDLRFEPPLALTPGADALSAIRTIVAAAPAYLAPGAALALEHGHDQAAAVHALLGAAGFIEVRSVRDLAGILRVTHGRM